MRPWLTPARWNGSEMADTIDLPGAGAVPKKYAYAGIGVVLVAAGVYYYRKRNASTATAATSNAPINPATGYPEGSPEDLAAMAQLSATAPGYSPGPVAAGAGSNYTYPSPQFASNAAWEQAALDFLVTSAGADSSAVSKALGAYLSGSAVSPDQKSIIEEATGSQGLPPVAGPNGYPPSIREAPAPPPPAVIPTLATPHLALSGRGANYSILTWTMIPGATEYYVYLNGRLTSGHAGPSTRVNQHGSWTVAAVDRTGKHKASPQSNAIRV